MLIHFLGLLMERMHTVLIYVCSVTYIDCFRFDVFP